MRSIAIETDTSEFSDGSCIISFGKTKVICTANIEESVPPFLRDSNRAWLSAEYAMLPGSTPGSRKRREIGKRDGRSVEIQRLIGRSLRAAFDLENMGEISIVVDCDVLQADGGTRTAAISGGFVAAVLALAKKMEKSKIKNFIKEYCAAVSVGIVGGSIVCDLDYEHDSQADVDMNVVMLGDKFVEVQGTGERSVFSETQLQDLLASAKEGIAAIYEEQKQLFLEKGILL
jgi:ribonuclease PH